MRSAPRVLSFHHVVQLGPVEVGITCGDAAEVFVLHNSRTIAQVGAPPLGTPPVMPPGERLALEVELFEPDYQIEAYWTDTGLSIALAWRGIPASQLNQQPQGGHA